MEAANTPRFPTNPKPGRLDPMKPLLDSHPVELTCPHCRHKFSELIGKLKTNPTLTCSACKGRVEVDASDLRSKIAGVEKQLAQLQRALGRIGK